MPAVRLVGMPTVLPSVVPVGGSWFYSLGGVRLYGFAGAMLWRPFFCHHTLRCSGAERNLSVMGGAVEYLRGSIRVGFNIFIDATPNGALAHRLPLSYTVVVVVA